MVVFMKNKLKKVLPRPLIDAGKSTTQFFLEVNKPQVTSYSGRLNSVLQCFVAYNKYGGYCVPQSSYNRPAAQKILAGKVWESDTIEFMLNHAGEGDIVHAGTYFGDFIPALSQACRNSAKLWTFEPNPENYRCASITIAINNLQNVESHNAGLGARRDSIFMKTSDEKGNSLGGCSWMAEGDKSNQKQFTQVDILKLDDALPTERKVSIIQLDVECYEKQALMGAIETIKRCKPILILENMPDQDWLIKNIYNLGYEITGKLHENTVLITK